MKKNILFHVLLLVMLAVISAVFTWFLIDMRSTIKENTYSKDIVIVDTQVFYAEIIDVSDSSLSVKGIVYNAVNHRGDFILSIDDECIFTYNGVTVQLSEIKVGDVVAVYYSGDIEETYPMGIKNVERIVKLWDPSVDPAVDD